MKKKDGFPGQNSYVIPDGILQNIRKSPVFGDLHLTDIGYYPQARHHFRERPKGVNQTILIYTVSGSGKIMTGNNETRLIKDHFFIIPEGMPHAYSANQDDPWSIYWIHFSGVKAHHLAKPVLQPVPVVRSNTSRINERLNLFNEIFHNLKRGFSVEILEYVNLCLPGLIASFTHLTQYRSVNEHFTNDPVSQSINFMLENISQKYKLVDLAKAVNLSKSHYSHLFIIRTGHSPIEYFIQLKIQYACRLLDANDLTVADTAREAGFEDQFYFSRQFRKVMNMSPTQYRKR
jgi:AraC-like DNA-binding protein